ncbi:MAG TPA: hypothetical protein IAA23_00730 [Candidatus Helicobacter avistercoris]|nr:hypothetical protein [Candidatus Helicobacter avistercoris]
MFLHQLSTEEKKSFLEIAYHFAWSNDDFSDAQKEIIKGYCNEMQIEDIKYDRNNFDIHNVLLKISNPRSQKIVLLETMALIYADSSSLDSIHKGEKEVLDLMISSFGIDKHILNLYGEWTKCVFSLTAQGEILVNL